MKTVDLRPIGKSVPVKTEARVLDAVLAEQLNVLMACGGKGICATCHVWVEEGMDKLTPRTQKEERTLAWVFGANEKSRLCCQARVLGDGAVVTLPEGMYIESANELKTLIGQRAAKPILHPVTGNVLIEKGKIITRSRIMELGQVEFDMSELRAVEARIR